MIADDEELVEDKEVEESGNDKERKEPVDDDSGDM
jgi:hypothetical protein